MAAPLPNLLREMTEVEATYVGGMIDADGCIYVDAARGYRYVRVLVCNINLDIISALLRATGTGGVYYKFTGLPGWGKERKTPIWTWEIGSRATVRALLERIASYSTKAQERLEELRVRDV